MYKLPSYYLVLVFLDGLQALVSALKVVEDLLLKAFQTLFCFGYPYLPLVLVYLFNCVFVGQKLSLNFNHPSIDELDGITDEVVQNQLHLLWVR